MTTQLQIYNDALQICGERSLASLTEEREPRRQLDQVWASGGVNACLEMGQWGFAMRTVQIDYDPGVEPSFGYQRAFEKPDDWLLTSAVCTDEFFHSPLLRYWDEAGYWYSDLETIYVRFVSNLSSYGMDLGKWPESFRKLVVEYFANAVILAITKSEEKKESSDKRLEKLLLSAQNKTAMTQPTSFPPRGSWGLSRGGWGGRRDGGSRGGPLIG